MRRTSKTLTAVTAALCLPLLSCGELGNFAQAFNGDCGQYQQQYQTELETGGQLAAQVPAGFDSFAMGVVMNQNAVNDLFSRLGNVSLPVLSRTIGGLPLVGDITLAVQPALPTLGIGGNSQCVSCFTADVPFSFGVGFGDTSPNLATGTLSGQLPLGMLAAGDRQTALVAQFQTLDITGFSLDIDGVNNTALNAVLDQVEPISTALLSQFLRTRFEDAEVATFDSWALGNGDVLLAGRGPIVFPEDQTIMIAMRSNLISNNASIDAQSMLPDGADFGFVFDPNLLLAMTRRMNYEGVIPQSYTEAGAVDEQGGTGVTFQTMTADDGLLRTGATLFRTDTLCGTAGLAASMGLQVDSNSFAFTVQDVAVTDGQGLGSLFSQDNWVTGPLMTQLLSTLDFTINYDQIFGGEAMEQSSMAPFQAGIDARGISVYFNL